MSPALAGSASTVQSPRRIRVSHFTPLGFIPDYIVPLRTTPDTPPDRARLNHRLTQTHGAPTPGHLAGVRGAGLQRPITGRGAGPAWARPRPRRHAVALAGRAATWPGRRPSLRRIEAVGGNSRYIGASVSVGSVSVLLLSLSVLRVYQCFYASSIWQCQHASVRIFSVRTSVL